MNNAESRSYLFQQDVVPDYPKCLMRGEWTTLYMKADEESARFESSSALAPLDKVPELLKNPDWDLKPELGGPEFLKTGVDLDAFYFEYGCRERMCPIIFLREFSGSYPQYFELAEDFRLYHNLAEIPNPEDRNQRTLFKIENGGERIEVARVAQDTVSVKSSFLRGFLEAAELCLVLYVVSRRFSSIPIGTIPKPEREKSGVDDTTRWEMRIGEYRGPGSHKTFSWFSGKAAVGAHSGSFPPLP